MLRRLGVGCQVGVGEKGDEEKGIRLIRPRGAL